MIIKCWFSLNKLSVYYLKRVLVIDEEELENLM